MAAVPAEVLFVALSLPCPVLPCPASLPGDGLWCSPVSFPDGGPFGGLWPAVASELKLQEAWRDWRENASAA
jgi:hypothetical protein